MPSKNTRREFLKVTAATGVGFWVAGGLQAQESKSPNEKIRMASVGVGGKGSSDSSDAGSRGEMVAICDVDTARLEGAGKKWPNAKQYTDYRKMLEEMGEKIDAVTVSTPDHNHAPAGLMAMRMGKHCFCQKPMTHSIYEARLMGQTAKEKGVATQMGNQGTAGSDLRKAAAMMRAGRLGTVTEVHVWTNRPIWPQGGERPAPQDPPANLKWEQWIGPAPMRPYGPGYHPFSWRGWWDFGTGALGDMACHTMNMPYMGLDLRDPVSVQAETSGHNRDSYPKWSIITYEFPANDWRPALKMFWYDGGKKPDPAVLDGDAPKGSGCVVIGSKGKLYSGNDYGGIDKIYGDVDTSEIEFKRSPGHFEEWVIAIRGGEPAMSNFPGYASPLTETVLLGNLAVWVANEPGQGQKVEWDAENLKARNISGLEQIIKPVYRDGYKLDA
jgi:predicted dehydrogenase